MYFDYSADFYHETDHINCFKKKITLIKEHLVVVSKFYEPSITILDLSLKSPTWVTLVDTLVSRNNCGIGVLNDCLYAVSFTYCY